MSQSSFTSANGSSWEREAKLLRFEDAWREQGAPVIDEFLQAESSGGSVDLPLLVELCKIDIEHRVNRGAIVNIADYSRRYPELRNKELDADLSEFALEVKTRAANRPTMPRTGDIVKTYELQSQIGEGTFAIVFAAWDKALRRKVAVKLLRRSKSDRQSMMQRMRREALAIATLRHPNVVPVYDAGSHNGIEFIVTGLIEGDTLEDALKLRRFSLAESVEIVKSLAEATQVVHQHGIVHRDIKPSNVMLDGDRPMLFDFGLAHVADTSLQLTHEGDLLGTPAYMSPEQANGKGWHADPRSDVYSLGAVLFRLVCGRLPFEGSMAEVVHQVIERECPDPSKVNNSVNRDLRTIILKCLAKEPDDRYQSAGQFAADLGNFLEQKPIAARPIGVLGRLVRFSRRKPVVAGLVASSLLLAAFFVGTATQLHQVRKQRDKVAVAEKQSKELLMNASLDAGKLAAQRGHFEQATIHFQQALLHPNVEKDKVRLRLAKTQIANKEPLLAVEQIKRASNGSANADEYFAAELLLAKAEVALRDSSHFGRPMDVLQSIDLAHLPPADRHYLSALVSESTPDAVEQLRAACSKDPYHYAARRMLVISLFALARFDEAHQEISVAREFFDQDTDFRLIHAVNMAAIGDIESAKALVNETDMAASGQMDWARLCEFVFRVTQNVTIDRFSGDLDIAQLNSLSVEFVDSFASLFQERDWRLPPIIASRFSRLSKEIENLVHAPSIELCDWLTEFAETHPEGSVLLLLGTTYLSQVPNQPDDRDREIQFLEQARVAYRRAAESHVFVNGTRNQGHIGEFTSSVVLASSYRHKPKENFQQCVEAMKKIVPANIINPDQIRAFVISSFRSEDVGHLGPWLARWEELSSPNSKHQKDALWHRGVFHQRRQEWLEVIDTCDRLIELDPDNDSVKAMRGNATSKIEQVILRSER